LGGVEIHIWCLAQCLVQRGHKVIIVTHAYEGRQGIRYMTNGVKVYYLPIQVVYDQVILPTLFSFFALFRNILIRERISIVHGHQSVSPMTHECLLYARTLEYRTCYTDHSLFGFADISSIHINKVLQVTLSDIDHVISVSNACRENLVIRARIHPSLVSTIPNAVDSTKFTPNPAQRTSHSSSVNIVVLSRLVYRKGIDLLIKLIPYVCAKAPMVKFFIGGDGPKRILLEEMRERYQLHEQVELLGAIPHHRVHETLLRGHIFLNCSLTESFCIALLEAASCGLFVVSTNVGGVPEVLPPSMIKFADPNTTALGEAVLESISLSKQIDPWEVHQRVQSMYNWMEVTKRTEVVYHNIALMKRPTLLLRLVRHLSSGLFVGPLACLWVIVLHLYGWLVAKIWPREEIEIAHDLMMTFEHAAGSRSSSTDKLSRRTSSHHRHHHSHQQSHSSSSYGDYTIQQMQSPVAADKLMQLGENGIQYRAPITFSPPVVPS